MSYYVSTAIYYANGRLHIGHAYEAVAADAFARYHRALGEDVWFQTGTDEHGIKIQRKAEAAGVAPQAWVDSIAPEVQAVLDRLGVGYDRFIRTTEAAGWGAAHLPGLRPAARVDRRRDVSLPAHEVRPAD